MLKTQTTNNAQFIELSKLSLTLSRGLFHYISPLTFNGLVNSFFWSSYSLVLARVDWLIYSLTLAARNIGLLSRTPIRGNKLTLSRGLPSSVTKNLLRRNRPRTHSLIGHSTINLVQHKPFMEYRHAFLNHTYPLHTPRRRVNLSRHFILNSSAWKKMHVPKFSKQIRSRKYYMYRSGVSFKKLSWFISLIQMSKSRIHTPLFLGKLNSSIERRFLQGRLPKKLRAREGFFFPKQDLFLNSGRTPAGDSVSSPLFIKTLIKILNLRRQNSRRTLAQVQINGSIKTRTFKRFLRRVSLKRQSEFNRDFLVNEPNTSFTSQVQPDRDCAIQDLTPAERDLKRKQLGSRDIVSPQELKRQITVLNHRLGRRAHFTKMSTNYGGLGSIYQSPHRQLRRRTTWTKLPYAKGFFNLYRKRTMRPLFQLLNVKTRLDFTNSQGRASNTFINHRSVTRLRQDSRSLIRSKLDIFRQLVKHTGYDGRESASLARFKDLKFRRRVKIKKQRKKKTMKRRKKKPVFKKRRNKSFIFAQLTRGPRIRKHVSRLKIKQPKNNRNKKKVTRRILLSDHVRRLRRLFSRTLMYQARLLMCMPRLNRIKRVKLQHGVRLLKNTTYLSVFNFVGCKPHRDNAPVTFKSDSLYKNVRPRPKRLPKLTRLLRSFKQHRVRYRFKRKKVKRFKRRRVPAFLKRKLTKPLTRRLKFNPSSKWLSRVRRLPLVDPDVDNVDEYSSAYESDSTFESFRTANKVYYTTSVQSWQKLIEPSTARASSVSGKNKNYFKTLRQYISRQKRRLTTLITNRVRKAGDSGNLTLLTNYVRFVKMRKSQTLNSFEFETTYSGSIAKSGGSSFLTHQWVRTNLTKARVTGSSSNPNLVRRPSLCSQNQTPFVSSSVGFLFLKTDAVYKHRADKVQMNKHRFSFFYSMDVKRSILRSKRAYVSSAFDTSVEKTPQSAFFSTNELGTRPLNVSTSLLTLSSMQHSFTSRSRFTYERDNDLFYKKEVALKRIKFKPGYSRIWRRARTSLKTSLQLNARYQYKLTRHLVRMSRLSRNAQTFVKELTLQNVLLNSGFAFDDGAAHALLTNNAIYLNGVNVSNPLLTLFKGDFVQLVVNLKYYILIKWLANWNKFKRTRLARLSYSKFRKSANSQHKQRSLNFPNWILTTRVKNKDIPNYLEVDFFTLSSFVLYEPFTLSELNTSNMDEDRTEIFNLYNWKYIN